MNLLSAADKVKFQKCLDEARAAAKEAGGYYDESKAVQLGTQVFLQHKCLTDLYFLGSEILGLEKAKTKKGKPLLYPPLHKWVAGQLQAAGSKMLIMPRFSLKTTWVKVWMVQRILQDPNNVRIAYVSRTSSLGRITMKDVVRLLMTPLLREIFPNVIPATGKLKQGLPTAWDRITDDFVTVHRDRSEGNVPQEHQIEVYGVESTIVGRHFTDQVYDDLIDEDTVRSPTMMEKALEFVRYSINLLVPDGNELYVGTPYHYADLIYHCINEKFFKTIIRRSSIENGKAIYPTLFPLDELARRKKRMGNYIFSCNPGYAPIWMADFSFRELSSVKVGDEVVGFVHGDFDNRCVFQKSTVTGVAKREAETVRVQLNDGSEVICTADHKWYTGRQDPSHRLYAEPRVGRKMLRAVDAKEDYEADKASWGYLAGIIDGEGACKHGGIISIAQSAAVNPEVVAKIRTTLLGLGIDFDERREDKPGLVSFTLRGGRQMKVNLLRYGQPAKKTQIINGMWEHPKRPVKDRLRVVSITQHRTETVYSLQTTTGNYVAWGYLSKNCMMLCDPLPKEDLLFPPPQPTYHALPGDKLDWYIAVDPAGTTQVYSDFTAFAVAAVDSIGRVWVDDCFQVKKAGEDIARIILQMNERYKPKRIGIEAGLQMHLMSVIQLMHRNWELSQGHTIFLPIEALTVSTKDKFDRINMTVGSWIRTDRLKIKETLADLMGQMEKMNRNYSGHDDMVDAVSLIFSLVPTFAYKQNQNLQTGWKDWWTFEERMKRPKAAVSFADRFAV